MDYCVSEMKFLYCRYYLWYTFDHVMCH